MSVRMKMTKVQAAKLTQKGKEHRAAELDPKVQPFIIELLRDVAVMKKDIAKLKKELKGRDTQITNLSDRAIRAEQMASQAVILAGDRSGGDS